MLQLPRLGGITPRFNTIIRKIDFDKGFADIEVELNPATVLVRVVRPKTSDSVEAWLSSFQLAEEGRTLRQIKLSVDGNRITLNKILINGTWYEVHDSVE
jgi:hypothetical protein